MVRFGVPAVVLLAGVVRSGARVIASRRAIAGTVNNGGYGHGAALLLDSYWGLSAVGSEEAPCSS